MYWLPGPLNKFWKAFPKAAPNSALICGLIDLMKTSEFRLKTVDSKKPKNSNNNLAEIWRFLSYLLV
jgi:hypothetical protein